MHSLVRWTRNSRPKYKKIRSIEHKFVTLYVINSAQNIFILFFEEMKFTRTNNLNYRVRLIPSIGLVRQAYSADTE